VACTDEKRPVYIKREREYKRDVILKSTAICTNSSSEDAVKSLRYQTGLLKETYKRDLQKRCNDPFSVICTNSSSEDAIKSRRYQTGMLKETCVYEKRSTKETFERDLQKRPVYMERDLQKTPTIETYKKDPQTRPTKETYKRDLQKRPAKET